LSGIGGLELGSQCGRVYVRRSFEPSSALSSCLYWLAAPLAFDAECGSPTSASFGARQSAARRDRACAGGFHEWYGDAIAVARQLASKD
jgi:hypothetical protein